MGKPQFYFKNLVSGNTLIPVLHPTSREEVFRYSMEHRVVAKTGVASSVDVVGPAPLRDPTTLWVVEEIWRDPEYISGFRARGVTYLDNTQSTEIITAQTPWLDLDWFVPVNSVYKE